MGVETVRLTGGEPLVRRDFPALAAHAHADRRPRRGLGHDQRLPAGARRRRAGRRPASPASTSASTRCSATASSPRPAATRCPASCAAWSTSRRSPRRTRSRSTRSRSAASPSTRSSPSPASPASTPTRCASSSTCRSTATALGHDPGPDRRGDPRRDPRRLPARSTPTRAPHATARVHRFADGRGAIGFINPVSEPFCGDCDRIRLTADGRLRTCLFSLNETDLRTPAARRRDRRRPRSASSATRSGARSSSTASTSRASSSPRGRCPRSAARPRQRDEQARVGGRPGAHRQHHERAAAVAGGGLQLDLVADDALGQLGAGLVGADEFGDQHGVHGPARARTDCTTLASSSARGHAGRRLAAPADHPDVEVLLERDTPVDITLDGGWQITARVAAVGLDYVDLGPRRRAAPAARPAALVRRDDGLEDPPGRRAPPRDPRPRARAPAPAHAPGRRPDEGPAPPLRPRPGRAEHRGDRARQAPDDADAGRQRRRHARRARRDARPRRRRPLRARPRRDHDRRRRQASCAAPPRAPAASSSPTCRAAPSAS